MGGPSRCGEPAGAAFAVDDRQSDPPDELPELDHVIALVRLRHLIGRNPRFSRARLVQPRHLLQHNPFACSIGNPFHAASPRELLVQHPDAPRARPGRRVCPGELTELVEEKSRALRASEPESPERQERGEASNPDSLGTICRHRKHGHEHPHVAGDAIDLRTDKLLEPHGPTPTTSDWFCGKIASVSRASLSTGRRSRSAST